MKMIVAATCLCAPLLLGGCIVAAAGAGAGAGVALSDSEQHDGHDRPDVARDEDGTPLPPARMDEEPPPPAAPAPPDKNVESESLPPSQ